MHNKIKHIKNIWGESLAMGNTFILQIMFLYPRESIYLGNNIVFPLYMKMVWLTHT